MNGSKKKIGVTGRSADAEWARYSSILEKHTGINLDVSGKGRAEPLALMDYPDELNAKSRALSEFLDGAGIVHQPDNMVPSPMPRHYRTTTKRRTRYTGNRLLLLAGESAAEEGDSLLEPETHSLIYRVITPLLNERINRTVARALNFVIIRGSYTGFSLIFNVSALSADIVRGCGKIAERTCESVPLLLSAFIYHDPSGSKYYFENIQSADGLRMKRLFGPGNLAVSAGGVMYLFHPAGFSQVNLSIADDMLAHADRLLSPVKGARLTDLYCGYGFFSCYLSKSFTDVTGIDYDSTSIKHARANMRRLHGQCGWRFYSGRVEPMALSKVLPRGITGEYMLLDPPRRGTVPGVIENLAERKPARVLHVFCGVEVIPGELARWKNCGLKIREIVPLDMFPGTASLEVMVLLG